MKYRYACLIIILWWFCLSCSEPTKPKDGESNGIVGNGILGKWNWLESVGVETGLRATPASVGYTQTFRFDRDSVFYHYRNNKVTVSGRYWITFEVTFLTSPDTTMLLRTDKWTPFGSQWGVFFTGIDTLTLADLAFDVGESRFIRIK